MKKTTLSLILTCFILSVRAQVNFSSSSDQSGIVKAEANGFNVGYQFTSSQALFSYGITKETSYRKPGANGAPTISASEFTASNFKLAATVADGSGSIFSAGKFAPGLGLTYEYVHNKDDLNGIRPYFFYRFNYAFQQNSFGSIDATDSIRINKKFNHTIGFTPGFDLLFNDKKKAILAFSGIFKYNINPVDDLTAKDYSTDYTAAKNGIIQKSEKAFSTTQDDYFSVTPKVDFIYTPWILKNSAAEEISRVGFISSLSAKWNAHTSKIAKNFSIGPSIHPGNSSSSVIACLQAEFTDFDNSTGTKTFKDIFAVNFYVGIPISLK